MERSTDFRLTQSLLKQNWNQLRIDDTNYSFKCLFTDNAYEILIFDLNDMSLYFTKKNENEILDLLKELNPSIEVPLTRILAHLNESLSSTCQLNEKLFTIVDQTGSEKKLVIDLNSKLSVVRFKWRFSLNKLSNAAVKEHILLPLMFNCSEYQLREHELVRIIQAKDKELDDLKSQGAKLSRKHLATEIFTQEGFDQSLKHKGESKTISECPEKCLYTQLSHKISENCITKYMSSYLKPAEVAHDVTNKNESTNSTQTSDASASNETSKRGASQSSNTNPASQKETRLKELEAKLKEENDKKSSSNDSAKKAQKKKKLF